jgi:hypothetical protein
MLNPRAIAFIFKQYCQSIIKYGLENLYLSNAFRDMLNLRQNILLKNVLGLKRFARCKALFNELGIESVNQLYQKHKVFGIKQFAKNDLASGILEYLSAYYTNCEIPKASFISQLYEINAYVGISLPELKVTVERIERSHQCNDVDLRTAIFQIINDYDINYSYVFIEQLNACLRVDFFT